MDERAQWDKEDLLGRVHPHNHRLLAPRAWVEQRDAHELVLDPSRIDLVAKYVYARARLLRLETKWPLRFYREHIWRMSRFRELGGSKNSFDDYLSTFDTLIDSIGAAGFDSAMSLVPVNTDGSIVDGAHRVAACAAAGKPVTVVYTKNAVGHDYSYGAFVRRRLSRKWLDALAFEHCRLNPRTRIVTVFPRACNAGAQVEDILAQYGRIVAEKRVWFRRHGPHNFVRVTYAGEPWLGRWGGAYPGAKMSAHSRFPRLAAVRAIVFDCADANGLREAKEKIRVLLGGGNETIHINDTHPQTLHLAQVLFNANSIHFLNRAFPREPRRLYELLQEYGKLADAGSVDSDRLCVDGSAVMAAYGIRDCRDLDVIHHGEHPFPGNADIGSHNGEAKYYSTTLDDVIYNPENHFYHRGFKFASLKVVARMKRRRGEDKDRKDVALIRVFLLKSNLMLLIWTCLPLRGIKAWAGSHLPAPVRRWLGRFRRRLWATVR